MQQKLRIVSGHIYSMLQETKHIKLTILIASQMVEEGEECCGILLGEWLQVRV